MGSSIGSGTRIIGRIISEGDLEIGGHVEGTIEAAGELLIADGATVKSAEGDISGERVSVRGAVNGSIRGRAAVLLETGARVVGDLTAPSISIQPGALVRGRVETADTPSKPRSSVATATKAAPRPRAVAAPKPVKKAAPAKAKAPAPVMPKASSRAKKVTKKAAARKAVRSAPAPKVPALKKRAKRATKRSSR